MKAVEDPVGGNDHALAQKIAAKHPGMQPILIWKETIFASVCIFINTMSMLVTTK